MEVIAESKVFEVEGKVFYKGETTDLEIDLGHFCKYVGCLVPDKSISLAGFVLTEWQRITTTPIKTYVALARKQQKEQELAMAIKVRKPSDNLIDCQSARDRAGIHYGVYIAPKNRSCLRCDNVFISSYGNRTCDTCRAYNRDCAGDNYGMPS